MPDRALSWSLVLALGLGSAGCAGPRPAELPAPVGQTLFDGRSLGGFVPSVFGGDGEIGVEDGRLVLGMGSPLTGVVWRGAELPRTDYEVELTAARLAGSDFFCGLTFPVGEGHATLVLGGWGGSLCGISSIDGYDASENETTKFIYLETGREFAVRLRVRPGRIEAWLDGEPLVDVSVEGREVSTRPEVEGSLPFGIASFATRAAIGPVRLRRL
jgi:hypothetical protein